MIGKEAFIIAGGPSVTVKHIELALDWAKKSEDRAIFAVNKSVFEIPQADYGFSRDTTFITEYFEKLEKWPGQFIVGNGCITPPWAKRIDTQAYISGAACIEAATRLGYVTIYLLGADGHINGGNHWHADYRNLANVPNWEKFDGYYAAAIQNCAGIEVYNCSPGTAITSVPTREFEEVCPQPVDS